jgi:hypothetical protein
MPALVVLLAAIAALASYRVLEEWTGRNWIPAGCRAAGWGAVALLLVNASCPVVLPSTRPVVLLDASLSMQAAGGRWSEALALARAAGDVRFIGVPPGDTTPSGGRSRVAAAITGARSAGRPVIVVTDGEVEDVEDIPPGVLEGATVRLLPRRDVAVVAITRIEAVTRLTAADSLAIDVEARSMGSTGGARALELEAREGDRVWLRGRVELDAAGRGHVVLRGPLPRVAAGTHVLSIALAGVHDSEPRDDARLLVVSIVPTPGVVLLASPPTWESRFLFEALRDVAALPVRGYLETEPGRWRRAGDLHAVPVAEVADAARRADLVVTLGDPGEVARRNRGRGVWSWPAGPTRTGAAGDWYVSVGPGTPISGAFAGLSVDSFPPATALVELAPTPRDWIGFTVQAGRRGAVRPAMIGRDSAGERRVVTGIDGLWRWGFRGGSSEQGYRGLVAATVSWLLGGVDSAAGRARLRREVVQRGRPAVFEWSGPGPAVPIAVELSGADQVRRDTLVFDGSGRAEVLLPPGVWRYRLNGGGEGTVAVESYSDEWLPAPRTLAAREASAPVAPGRRPVRDWIWLFGIAAFGFAGEWFARRRLGLR